MAESFNTPTIFRPGQILAYSNYPERKFVLLERFHAVWPTWSHLGKWWQWWVLDDDSTVQRVLENTLTETGNRLQVSPSLIVL